MGRFVAVDMEELPIVEQETGQVLRPAATA